MHKEWKWFEVEQRNLRMAGVDVSQLEDASFMMDHKAHVDNIDPGEIKLERRKTPEASVTERQKSTLRGLWRERYNGRAHKRTQSESPQGDEI